MLLLVVSLTGVALVASARPVQPANSTLAGNTVKSLYATQTGLTDSVHVHTIPSQDVEYEELDALDSRSLPRGDHLLAARASDATRSPGETVVAPGMGYSSAAAIVGVVGAGGIVAFYLRRRIRKQRREKGVWELLPVAEEGRVQLQEDAHYTMESTEAFASAYPGSIDLQSYPTLTDLHLVDVEEDVTLYAQNLPRSLLVRTKALTSPSSSVPGLNGDFGPSRVIPVMTRASALDLVHSQESDIHEDAQLIHLEEDLIHFDATGPPKIVLVPGDTMNPRTATSEHQHSWGTDIAQSTWDAEGEVRAWVLDQTSSRSPGSHLSTPSTRPSMQTSPSLVDVDWSPVEVPLIQIEPPTVLESRRSSPLQDGSGIEEEEIPASLVLLQVESPTAEQTAFISPILPELRLSDAWGKSSQMETRWAVHALLGSDSSSPSPALIPLELEIFDEDEELEEGDTLVAAPELDSPSMECKIALPLSDSEDEIEAPVQEQALKEADIPSVEDVEDLQVQAPSVDDLEVESPLSGRDIALPSSDEEEDITEDEMSSGTDIEFVSDDEDYYVDAEDPGFLSLSLSPSESRSNPTVMLSPPQSMRSSSSRGSGRPRIRDIFAQSPDSLTPPSCRPAWSIRAADVPSLSVTHAPSLSAISRAPSFNNLARAAAGLKSPRRQTPSPSSGSGSPRATPFSTPLNSVAELPSSPVRSPKEVLDSKSEEESHTAATEDSLAAAPRQRRAFRSPVPDIDLMPLDLALAMQLRPGLGAGADAAFLVRFLMAMFGWFAVLVTGVKPKAKSQALVTEGLGLDVPTDASEVRTLSRQGSPSLRLRMPAMAPPPDLD